MDIFIGLLLCVIQPMAFGKTHSFELSAESARLYGAEVKAGSQADMMENKHVYHAHKYPLKDLNRRRAMPQEYVLPDGAIREYVSEHLQHLFRYDHMYLRKSAHVYDLKSLRDCTIRFDPMPCRSFGMFAAIENEDAVGDFHANVQMARNMADEEDPRLIPMKASPELVLAVAKESAKIPLKYDDENERVKILRSGDYWNGYWKEDVDPVKLLRTNDVKEEEPKPEDLESVKAKIMPGSKLYHLVSVLQRISPKLLYIINKPK